MQQILNTLYVMTPNAYVHLENDTLRIDVEREKKMQVPLHHLGSVVCFGNVMVSPALMHRLAGEGKSLVLLDENGRFKARVEGPISGNILLRRAHHARAGEAAFMLEAAKACVAGKLRNCRQVLLRGAREASDASDRTKLDEGAEYLAQSVRNAGAAADIDALRGVEGDGARTYFACLGNLVRKDLRYDFAMNGRTRRPPLDRFNALLGGSPALRVKRSNPDQTEPVRNASSMTILTHFPAGKRESSRQVCDCRRCYLGNDIRRRIGR